MLFICYRTLYTELQEVPKKLLFFSIYAFRGGPVSLFNSLFSSVSEAEAEMEGKQAQAVAEQRPAKPTDSLAS